MSLIKSQVTIIFIIFSLYVSAQQFSPNQLKTVLTYKIAQNIDWENEAALKQFNIGIITNDVELIKVFNSAFQGKTLKNVPVTIRIIDNDPDFKNLHLLYVDKYNSSLTKDFLSYLSDQSTLLITDNAPNKKYVMINLYDDNDQIKFEVNKANIILNKMKIGSKLLLLGGTEIDVAQLYKDTQSNLDKEKEKAKQQEEMLGIMRKEIDKKKAEIDQQKIEMILQEEQLNAQKKQIDDQKTVLKSLSDNVTNQQKLLEEKVKQAEQQMRMIHQQEESLKRQQSIMQERTTKLNALTAEIDQQQEKINKQKFILAEQGTQIKIQQNLIFVFALFGVLIAALAFFIFRGLQIQKRFNKQLGEKNAEIQRQSLLLEREREHTLNSINYAKTIQNAVLPSVDEINKYINTFVVFKPKDIVSGDFYWHHYIPAMQGLPEKIFIAAIDCTGHGVPGAFMSMIGSSLLNQIVKEKDIHSPCDILENLHNNIKFALKQGQTDNNDGMDACFCLIEKHQDKVSVTFTGAKRPLYYILPQTKELLQLKGDRKSIGGVIQKIREVNFTNQTIDLPKGSAIYLSTDGYADQNNESRLKFGVKKFESMLVDICDADIHMQKSKIENTLKEHQGNVPQRDDITVIGIKI
ncbi:MAG: YfiR/HmsC family protein [Cytophagales bacterium]|nr:YfiR/HmsC family protein [Cytophagales bacterium]